MGSDSKHSNTKLQTRAEQERRESNPQPVVLETAALPVELRSSGSSGPAVSGQSDTGDLIGRFAIPVLATFCLTTDH